MLASSWMAGGTLLRLLCYKVSTSQISSGASVLKKKGGSHPLFNFMAANAVLLLGSLTSVGRYLCHNPLQVEVSEGTGVPPVVRVNDPHLYSAGILVCQDG
jgi:hypothetical protein